MTTDRIDSAKSAPLKEMFGFVYCATGRRHFEEACQSVRHNRAVMPNIGYTLFTDAAHAKLAQNDFDQVLVIEKPSFSYDDKIEAMVRSPYEKTLFVDTDTVLVEPLYEIIDLLDTFDLAYTHDVHRGTNYEPECPECFAEPCTAVMGFRKSEAVTRLWKLWRERFDWEKEHRSEHPLRCLDDQGAFRHVLYHEGAGLHTYVLPSEYNLRVHAPWLAGAVVKLVHGRGPNLARALRQNVNRDITIRVGDGMNKSARAWFNFKRWIKNRILNRPALYDFRLRGMTNSKPVTPWLPAPAAEEHGR
jgi:hypothetical protein